MIWNTCRRTTCKIY